MNKGKNDVTCGRKRRSLARGKIDYWAQCTEEHQWIQGYLWQEARATESGSDAWRNIQGSDAAFSGSHSEASLLSQVSHVSTGQFRSWEKSVL